MKPKYTIDAIINAGRHLPGFACFDTENDQSFICWSRHTPFTETHGWEDFVRRSIHPSPQVGDGFSGGVIGWLGYEAGRTVEAMPRPLVDRATHDLCLWRVDGAIEFNNSSGEVIVRGDEGFHMEAMNLLTDALTIQGASTPTDEAKDWKPPDHDQRSVHYREAVKAILDHVHAGDVYQVNLAWEQTAIPMADAATAWLRIRSTNPAARGCYLRQSGVEILSNSPELFLSVDGSNGRVKSIPIKGTAAQSGGEVARKRLEVSPKEKAELTMIVDLVRNDLGRVAIPGTVYAHPRTLRRCGDLWHAEQPVDAQLSSEHDAISAVAASFPPGSVTGAPKVRAMEVIHSLETAPRGVYTGTIGWFADGGDAHLNVAIRTATVVDGLARFHVGAGIVAESKPEREWVETLEKARILAHCLGARTHQ